jgi:hypothetical protein
MIILFFSAIILSVLWLSYEIWRAPLLDHNYRVIEKEKTFRDLLQKLKLWR